MSKEAEVSTRLAYPNLGHPLRPDIPFRGNRFFIVWAKDAGYDGVEFHALRGPTSEILRTPIEIISGMQEIQSGHVIPNPYATVWKILTRKPDPLRPHERLALYNFAIADNRSAIEALKKLELARGGNFSIVTYPYEVARINPYGEYAKPLVQTHPAVFNDESAAEDFIAQVRAAKYAGVVWDTYHALEATASGKRPLTNWRESLEKLLKAGVISEVHAQLGRTLHVDSTIKSLDWLKGAVGTNPKYNNDFGQMLKMVKDADPTIPFVVEVSIDGLIQAGLIPRKVLLTPAFEAAKQVHRELVNYIKRV